MKKIPIFLGLLFSSYTALSQEFLALLKAVETSTRNYQIDEDIIEFAEPEFSRFTGENFIVLYNYTYDTHYELGSAFATDELLKNETSAEYLKYREIQTALRQISMKRHNAIAPIGEKIDDLQSQIRRSKSHIRAFREVGDRVVREENERMQKLTNRVNTLNAIGSFAAGFTGSYDNITYWVTPSSAWLWSWSKDFTNDDGVPLEMRKNYDFHEIRSSVYVDKINDFIGKLNNWNTELESKIEVLAKEERTEKAKWDQVESDFVQKNLSSESTKEALLESALKLKYGEWYNSELKQIKDSFTRKFGPDADHEFVALTAVFAERVKEYSYDMQRYASYRQDEEVHGLSYERIARQYERIQKNPGSSTPKFAKIHESMGALKVYVDANRAKSAIFDAYIAGKKGDYFYYVRYWIQPQAQAPFKSIEGVVSDMQRMKSTLFTTFSKEVSFLIKDLRFDDVTFETQDPTQSFDGLENIHSKKAMLNFTGNTLDANSLLMFNAVQGLEHMEIRCDCKIKNLAVVKQKLKFSVTEPVK